MTDDQTGTDDQTATDTTVLVVLQKFAEAGWTTNFVAEPNAAFRCTSCDDDLAGRQQRGRRQAPRRRRLRPVGDATRRRAEVSRLPSGRGDGAWLWPGGVRAGPGHRGGAARLRSDRSRRESDHRRFVESVRSAPK